MLVPHGLAAGAWHALAPGVAQGSEVAWEAIFDFSSGSGPRVRYAIGATTNAWLSLGAGSALGAVGFRGAGAFGSFRGSYVKVMEELEIRRPAFTGGGAPPGFDASGNFVVQVGEMVAGLHYTAFVSETVGGTYAAAADSVLADGETRSFAIPTGDSPALFVKIVASDHAFSAGDALPAGAQ